MNIDEALIERIIREVVSQVVAEKAAGGGQNRSATTCEIGRAHV